MSLKQAIAHKKEHRKEYYGFKAFDPACKNHGSCDWCNQNRHYRANREAERCEQEEREYKTS